MSTSNSGDQSLTQDEQTLHHHAAVVKRDVEIYHAFSRSDENWKALFKDHLVCFILEAYFYKSFSNSSRQNH